MARGVTGIALILVILAALYVGPALLKASHSLRDYRPDGPRLSATDDLKVLHSVGIFNTGEQQDHGA